MNPGIGVNLVSVSGQLFASAVAASAFGLGVRADVARTRYTLECWCVLSTLRQKATFENKFKTVTLSLSLTQKLNRCQRLKIEIETERMPSFSTWEL